MSPRKSSASPENFQVGPGMLVSLSYELYDAEGDLVEGSLGTEVLAFIHGYGQASPALERAIDGMSAGEVRRVRLGPSEAFGERESTAIIEVSRDELPPDLAVGDELSAENDTEAGPVCLTVLEVGDDFVVLDANHPLAGQRVELDVTVEELRPATSRELDEAASLLHDSQGRSAHGLIPARRLLKPDAKRDGGEGAGADPPPNRVA